MKATRQVGVIIHLSSHLKLDGHLNTDAWLRAGCSRWTLTIPKVNTYRQGGISEECEYHKKQVGHLYASTAFESYCHAFGLMLSAHELCRTLLQRIHI